MSTAMILGLPALVLLVGPANDSSQRSIKSSAEILGDTSAFRSPSARGSRDYKKGSHQRSEEDGGKWVVCVCEYTLNKDTKERERYWFNIIVSIKPGNIDQT